MSTARDYVTEIKAWAERALAELKGHDPICPKRATLPVVEAKMYPGSGLGLCEFCGALLPMISHK